jgi:rhodanese-related sulfurtransferase
MVQASLAVALLALLVALIALVRASRPNAALEEAVLEAKRKAGNLADELAAKEANLRQLVALMAAGGKPTREMVLEGQLWRDVSPAEGQRMVEQGARLIDVRSPSETAGGIIPGAMLIPVDQLEARKNEIPKDGKRTLIYCAGGGRSAAACEHLTSQGWNELYNLEGGFSAWVGPRTRP